MLNINHNVKIILQTFFLFSLTINTLSCQENNYKNEYTVIKRKTSEVDTETNKIKSKTEKEDIRFVKEIASKINASLFSDTKKVIISEEVTTYKTKDTITYVVYDIILKKDVDLKKLDENSIFGIKRISLYETPVTCTTFFNQEKITCVCENKFNSELLSKDDFIKVIKENTSERVKNHF